MPDTYIPSDIQTGLPDTTPLKIQSDTDARMNMVMNPAVTAADVPPPITDFSDFFNKSERVQNKLPQGMTLSDAFFSDDPKYKGIADNIIQSNNKQDPFKAAGLGVDIRTPYDQASKYLNKDYGFDYRRDNEDYYAQYNNVGKDIAKFVGRTASSAILKLGQGVAGLLAMAAAPFQDGHYWGNVSDNALVRALTDSEQYVKDQWLPVYQTAAARKMGFFHRMLGGDSTFWTDGGSDALAFMLGAMAPGVGIAKLGLAARLGESGELLNLGRLGKLTAGATDRLATTALNTASEAFFEAKGVYDGVLQKYSDFTKSDPDAIVTLPNGRTKKARDLSTAEIGDVAAHGAKNDFLANFPILLFSNAWETRTLYKALGRKAEVEGAKGISIGSKLEALVDKPSTKLGKLWQGPVGFYTKAAAEGFWWEGLWEENAQLAAQRLNDDSVKYDYESNFMTNFLSQMWKQTKEAFSGKDQEAATSIGLGAIMGIGGGAGVGLVKGEYSSEENRRAAAVAKINNAKDTWADHEIYQKDEQGQYIIKDGKPVIDEEKLVLRTIKIDDLAAKSAMIDKLTNHDLRQFEAKKLFADYAKSIIDLGKGKDLLNRLDDISKMTPQQIVGLGFDPNQQLGNPTDYKEYVKQLIDTHEGVSKLNLGFKPKDVGVNDFEAINQDRRSKIYKNRVYSMLHNELANDERATLDKIRAEKRPEATSASDTIVDQYNLLKLRQLHNDEVIKNSLDPKVKKNYEDINDQLTKKIEELENNEVNKESFKKVKKTPEGLYEYENPILRRELVPLINDPLNKLAYHLNSHEYHQLEAGKIADPKTGYNYVKGDLLEKAAKLKQNITKQAAKQDVKEKQPEQQANPVATKATTQSTEPDEDLVHTVSPDLKGATYEKVGEEFQVKDNEGNVIATTPTEDEAKAKTVEVNKATANQALKDNVDKDEPEVPEQPLNEIDKDNSDNLREIAQKTEEDNYKLGKKITDSLSVASKATEYNIDTKTAPLDDKGRPVFNFNQNPIIDTGEIKPGVSLQIKFDREKSLDAKKPDGSIKAADELFEEGNMNDGNIENAYFAIYYKYKLIGYLHDSKGAERLLTKNVDVEAEKTKLKATRKFLMENAGKTYDVKVSHTGFGFLNKGDKSSYTTINESLESDPNVKLAVKKGTTYLGQDGIVYSTRFGDKISEGATVLLVPNNFNGREEVVPIYVAKGTVDKDPKIKEIVQNGLLKYLETGDKKDLNNVGNYIYITSKPKLRRKMTNNGLFMDENGQLIFRTKNIIDMSMDDLLSQLLVNLNLNDVTLKSKTYVNSIRNSPAFTTNVFPQTIEGKKYYFHQHTIEFEPPSGVSKVEIKQKEEEVKAGDILKEEVKKDEESKEKSDYEKYQEFLKDSGFGEGFGEGVNDLDVSAVENIASQDSKLVLPGFTSFLQQTAIRSIGYLALSNTYKDSTDAKLQFLDQGTSNKDSVKEKLQNELGRYQAYLLLLKEDGKIKSNAQTLVNNLQLVINNYDTLFAEAEKKLKNVGLEPDSDSFYQDVTQDENTFANFDDESELQRNSFESLSQEVKKLIAFTPEKIENAETGVITNRQNAIGLPVLSRPKNVYNLVINALSDTYYEPTLQGFFAMVGDLMEHPNATVRKMAEGLNGSPNTLLVFQFFTNMIKFKTDYTQQLIYEANNGITVRNINANSNQITRVVLEDMQKEFLESPIMNKEKDEFGNTIYRVDPKRALPLVDKFGEIVDDKKNFFNKTDDKGVPNGGLGIYKAKAIELYDILKELGFTFTYQTFRAVIGARSNNNPKGDNQLGLKFYFTGGNKILETLTTERKENEPVDKDLRDPFTTNSTEMANIARIEVNQRDITKSDSFRSNGKSYYPFTRPSFIKSIFQQLVNTQQTGDRTPLLDNFLKDSFRGRSRTLIDLYRRKFDQVLPKISFVRGLKDSKGKDENTEIRDANEKDFIISKMHSFQNGGKGIALYYSDTYSDKTTRFLIRARKDNVGLTFNNGSPRVDDKTLELFYHYILGEYDRIHNVEDTNKNVQDEYKIAGFHDIDGKEGIGKYFVVFNFLNSIPELHDENGLIRLYDDEGHATANEAKLKPIIMNALNDQLIKNIKTYKDKLQSEGFFGDRRLNLPHLSDADYLANLSKSPDSNMNDENKNDIITADYVLNHSLNSIEMLTLVGGDPALSPKVVRFTDGTLDVNKSVIETLKEVSKRNASLNAPFDQGIAIRENYRVVFVNDEKINSEQFEEYKKLLGDKAKAYVTGDMTDAYEVTTIKEHLSNLLSMGRISAPEFAIGLARYDNDEFESFKPQLNQIFKKLGVKYNLDDVYKDMKRINLDNMLTPLKPVQRYSVWNTDLNQMVEVYIKTAAFPLIPEFSKGSDFEQYLKQMKANGIDRLNFRTGIKQGAINPQNLLEDGEVNENIVKTNVVTLPASAWGEQVLNPEKEQNLVTEGSQQQRMIFVDQHHDSIIKFQGKDIRGEELVKKYREFHKSILDEKVKKLFDELEISSVDGINNFKTLSKLSEVIQKEGINRDYDANTMQAIELNDKGQFTIPLGFLPNSSQIQSLISAIVSSRILRNKLPGKSLIQGSEIIIKTTGKLRVEVDPNRSKNSIVWTKAEYRNTSKLKYLRTENGEVKPAQIILPFFFRDKNDKLLEVSKFLDKDGLLDLSKIDSEMLEINGFRIPYAGLNSGMWFEVIGFLPEFMGDHVIVPAEIAAQMGADYDVDKLFTYVKNHTAAYDGIRVDNSDIIKQSENNIIDVHKAIYLHKDNMERVLDPTSTDELEDALKEYERLEIPSNTMPQIFDPSHQDNVWLSNRAGQLGIAISANANTLHASAQQANLFVKGNSVKFAKEDGDVYSDEDDLENGISKMDVSKYDYSVGSDTLNAITDVGGVNRLDRVDTFSGKKISYVIGNWLQASVDNAKLQMLGRAGINKFNFDVALSIISHGFDSQWAILFVNQPILKEYYRSISDINDRYNKNYTSGKKELAEKNLFNKYAQLAGVTEMDISNYAPQSLSSLKRGIYSQNEMTREDAKNQLEVLAQFLNLQNIARDLTNLSARTKTEVKGLPKSFTEIDGVSEDLRELDDSRLGNIQRLKDNTVSGLYLDIPQMIGDLFNYSDNPIFGYSSPAYVQVKSDILGKNPNPEEVDDLYKEVKQFIYTHPDFKLYDDYEAVKNSLFFTSDTNKSLVSMLKELKSKYPNYILLNQLSYTLKTRDNDPDILTINNSDEDITMQLKQDWFDFFRSSDPQLVTFANKLTTYALMFGSKEFGPSTLAKAVPFEVLKGMGFGDVLNKINKQLSDPNLFKNFTRQYIQHNPTSQRFISNSDIPKGNLLFQQYEGKANSIPAQFKMEFPTIPFINENPKFRTIVIFDPENGFEYRPFIRTYVNDTVGFVLFELQRDGLTYKRIDTLGNANISEYNFASNNVKSMFPMQQSQVATEADNKTSSPTTLERYSSYKTVDGTLGEIQRDNSSQDATPKEKMFAALAEVLEPSTKGFRIKFFPSTSRAALASTWIDGEDPRVEMYSQKLIRAAKLEGVTLKERLQGVLLHEATHVALDNYILAQNALPEGKQSSEFKNFKEVWNTYRRNFLKQESTETVRGIKDSFLNAELFKAIAKKTREKSELNFETVADEWEKIKKNKQLLLSTYFDMQESMKEAYRVHNVGEKADFDLVKKVGDQFETVDNERVRQITDYLGDKFAKTSMKDHKEKYYAYTSIREMATTTMTDAGFMKHLNTVPGLGTSKSLWDNFKDFVKKFVSSLGITFNDKSLLPNAIDAVLDLNKAVSDTTGGEDVQSNEMVENPIGNSSSQQLPLAFEDTGNKISEKLEQNLGDHETIIPSKEVINSLQDKIDHILWTTLINSGKYRVSDSEDNERPVEENDFEDIKNRKLQLFSDKFGEHSLKEELISLFINTLSKGMSSNIELRNMQDFFDELYNPKLTETEYNDDIKIQKSNLEKILPEIARYQRPDKGVDDISTYITKIC